MFNNYHASEMGEISPRPLRDVIALLCHVNPFQTNDGRLSDGARRYAARQLFQRAGDVAQRNPRIDAAIPYFPAHKQ